MYCEQCGEEDLKDWIELWDGTIVCSSRCEQEWEILVKANRIESN